MAAVKAGETWGYINKKGRMIIMNRFSGAGDFSEGLAAVRNNRREPKWGFINRKGLEVIKPQFDQVDTFLGGLARVIIRSKTGKSVKLGYIKKDGQFAWGPKTYSSAKNAMLAETLFDLSENKKEPQ